MLETAADTTTAAIDVTAYAHFNSPVPAGHAVVPWGEFVRTWTERGHLETTWKDEAPLWSPHLLRKNTSRAFENTLRASAVVLDLDSGGPTALGFTLQALRDAGIAFLAYTSHGHNPDACGCKSCEAVRKMADKSHKPGPPNPGRACPQFEERWKTRVVVPFAEPILANAWKGAYLGIRARFAPNCDAACQNPAHQFYVPSCPPGAPRWIVSNAGRALLGTDISAAPLHAVAPRVNAPISEAAFRRLAKRMVASKNLRKAETGERMLKVLAGEPYAEAGHRDLPTWEIARAIGEAYPDADPASVAALFERSLSGMPGTGLTVDEIAKKVARAQQPGKETEDLLVSDRYSRARAAWGTERVTTYTPEELAGYAATIGVDREDLHRYWFVLAGEDVYALSPGPEYRVVPRKNVAAAAATLLAPVPSPVSLVDADGASKSGDALLREYSTPLDRVVRSLYDQHPKIEERALVLPAAPLREVGPPQHDPEIAEWLRRLAGDAHDDLLTWLGHCTNLRTPLPALVLIGDKGAGKSLLAHGLARLWNRAGPTTLDQAMATFNDAIERCPLVFGDEHVPRDQRGNVRTEELRCLIQATEHQTNRKHRAEGALRGAVRVVIAANNEAVIELRGHLTREDVDAIAERLFYVDTHRTSAAEYLRTLGGRQKTDQWVGGDAIARHVLSLPRPPVTSRFGFLPGSSGLLAKRIAVRSGIRSAMCEWLVKGLLDGFSRVRGAKPVRMGDYLVTQLQGVYDSWPDYAGNAERPALAVIASALAGVCLRSQGEWHVVDLDMLRAWCKEHGYLAPERISDLVHRVKEHA